VSPVSYEEYRDSLSPIGVIPEGDPRLLREIGETAADIQNLPVVDASSLVNLIRANPDAVPVLGLLIGIGLEQLRGFLRHRFGTASWRRVVRDRAEEFIAALDQDFGLVEAVATQRTRHWTFADVLIARASGRSRASAASGRGRRVEDRVEEVVVSLGLQHVMRGRVVGRDGKDAPCDLAVPGSGDQALIVCAAKGFDSTGSKLSDAVGEIKQMAEVRLPTQFVFAVVDGIGWQRRQKDLRRIHELAQRRQIDGLFTLRMLPQFREELEAAAKRVGLLP
jgi:hypothetical protein